MAGPTPERGPVAPTRARAWLVGVALTSALVAPLSLEEGRRDLAGPSALLGLAITALVAELAASWPAGRAATALARSPDFRPADGVVEVVAIAGVEAGPNAADPRLARFVGPASRDRGPVARLARPDGPPRLLGRVALVSIFIDLDGGRWDDREIARGFRSLERAGLWIEGEAGRRGVPVNVLLAGTYFVGDEGVSPAVELDFQAEGDDVGPMEPEAEAKYLAVASRAASRLGFADLADLVARINPKVEADAHAWLLHLRAGGRSLAIPATESGLFGVGLAVCFAREASFPEPLAGPGRVDPLTVVHELLHLFGASDKYGGDLDAYPDGSVTPDDVMRMDHESLSRLRVDDRTAIEVGWGKSARRSGRKKPAGDR